LRNSFFYKLPNLLLNIYSQRYSIPNTQYTIPNTQYQLPPMQKFKYIIDIIGVNPFVPVPPNILEYLFIKSGKFKGPIPVKGKINGKTYIQTVVKFKGIWRLYLNTPMRKAAGIDVGDEAFVEIDFDNNPRDIPMHPELKITFSKNKKAKKIFDTLAPYRQKEIVRYLNSLKTEDSVKRNIKKILEQLVG
jgi:hypothetical protein